MSDTLKIWRVENADHVGPLYALSAETVGRLPWAKVRFDPLDGFGIGVDDDHPTPVHDYDSDGKRLSDGRDPFSWTIGLPADRKLLFNWFPPESLSWLEENGQHLVEFEVPREEVAIGRWQVLFRREKAKEVRRVALTDLLKSGK